MEQLFDKADEYDEMLNQGLKLSGESKEYFMHGRLALMRKHLPQNFRPKKILDFGCGIGDTAEQLATLYPDAQIVGTDTAVEAVAYANRNKSSERLSFVVLDQFDLENEFDLCYVNGVFHHIPLHLRRSSAQLVYKALVNGGYFALFENNPWNPGTRMVMKRIPFDRDAITLSHTETKELLKSAGFEGGQTSKFAFYFPAFLSFLRPVEPMLESLPLGAQYMVLAQK